MNMTTLMLGFVALTSLLFTATSSSLSVQASTDTATVLTITLLQAATQLPQEGRTLIGFADSLRVAPAQAHTIARAVALDYDTLNNVRKCAGGGSAYCHLVGARNFIEVTGVAFSRDTAAVDLTVMDETKSTRQPIHYAWRRMVLARKNGLWTTVRYQYLADT